MLKNSKSPHHSYNDEITKKQYHWNHFQKFFSSWWMIKHWHSIRIIERIVIFGWTNALACVVQRTPWVWCWRSPWCCCLRWVSRRCSTWFPAHSWPAPSSPASARSSHTSGAAPEPTRWDPVMISPVWIRDATITFFQIRSDPENYFLHFQVNYPFKPISLSKVMGLIPRMHEHWMPFKSAKLVIRPIMQQSLV